MDRIEIEKKYLSLPATKQKLYGWRRLAYLLISLLFFLPAIVLAYFWKTPGLGIRWLCMRLSLIHLLNKWDFLSAFRLVVAPLDSVRYFEFDFMLKQKLATQPKRCLDVSSPRLLAACLHDSWPEAEITLLNPDIRDFNETQSFVDALGFKNHCHFKNTLLENAELETESFDLVSCMSVLEHIPDDKEAVRHLWRLVKPGGTLMLTIPCYSNYYEEYTNLDDYKLFSLDQNGFVFWQRFYDEARLKDCIFSITGAPSEQAIYGENLRGLYDANVLQKRTQRSYPYWYEPLLMGRNFSYYDGFKSLTGMGVIGLVFKKSLPAAV